MSERKTKKLKLLPILVLIVLSIAVISLRAKRGLFILTADEAAEKAINYINENLVEPGHEAKLISVEEVSGVYKVLTRYRGNEIPVYVTKDGKWLFLSARDMTKKVERIGEVEAKGCEDLKKVGNPQLEAFVVSYCPFGLQMQRILGKIIEEIPELERYIKVRYIGGIVDGNITAMHGVREANENLRQICIREEQSEKYWRYIGCFIENGEAENCLKLAGVDSGKLEGCMEDGERGIKYASEDFELQGEYGVTGSPTLILNGEEADEFRFGGRTAEAVKTMLCCGFKREPTFCKKELSTETAATGFSETYSSGSSSSGQC